MSEEPHAIPCSEVLDKVYAYLDGELEETNCADIRQHLEECAPCLEEYGLEEAVKKVLAKCCGCDPAPAQLRARLLQQLAQARLGMGERETVAD
ncbi:mycothiol system anti-sigma-R factor [Thermobifida halotolerans]|uniref:Mycothiol system anti-sigma-R factor n=1 Tax=Thermobifida halotolerans TaxID=483545 RepID=A0A399G2Q7_9ACTN|nr:mycothiol system anti-sigma-R factor [Thermobifida halotolerans]UOE19628.1 mycothiol system anti-sigma-R factor [Thermobifida halotolerans]